MKESMSAAMKNSLNLSHLTEEECERILQVIQRDFELRQNEKLRLTKIEEEITEEDKKVEILGKQKNFNDNCCMRCFSRFIFIFNQKVQCFRCNFFICKSCSEYVQEKKAYGCHVCLKQIELEKESFDWFYNNVKRKFKRFGSAKVVRSLYKRKTDSDSENDSGYDPSLYSLSVPIGKRPRQSIQELLTSGSLNDSEVFSDASARVQENSTYYQPQYLNGVESSASYDLGSLDEFSNFKIHLNDIVNEVHQTLGARDLKSGTSADQYEHLLDNHRLRLCDELSHLSQSLYLTIDNQVSDNLPTPAAKHQYIKHLLTKEVENYVDTHIDLGDEATSEYASEDGSTSEVGRGYEEVLADAILKKIMADFMTYEDDYHREEEEKVRRDLTKLSNQCTITQLQDMMSTESETEDGQSHRTSADINESDLSDIQEEIFLESVQDSYYAPTSPRRDFMDSTRSTDSRKSSDSIDLDDLVTANSDLATTNSDLVTTNSDMATTNSDLVTTNSDVATNNSDLTTKNSDLATKNSGMVTTNSDMATANSDIVTPYSDATNANSDETFQIHSTHKITKTETHRVVRSEPVSSTPIRGQKSQDINSNDTSDDISASELLERTPTNNDELRENKSLLFESKPDVSMEQFSLLENDTKSDTKPIKSKPDDTEFENSYDEKSLLEFMNKRTRVALPSFTDDEESGTDLDLDDISRHSNENNGTLDSELFFGESWEVPPTNSIFGGWNQISAYDNYGDKKVGKDDDGPVFMLIPHVESRPKVGEREVTELSDGTLTDSEEEENDEEGEELNFAYMRYLVNNEPLQSTQTPAVDVAVSMETMTVAQEEELKRATAEALMKRHLEEEPTPDPEDADPRFVVKPRSQLIQEGEMATFICQVEGSADTDVFWYLDMADVVQLEDDDHFEITDGPQGTHTLTLFNTSHGHQGDYFCIAVNDNGQSHHSFKLYVRDNLGEKAAPKILKDIQDAEVIEGSSVSFRTKVQGYPTPRVTWLKDGTRLSNSASYFMEKIGNRDYMLTIRDATLYDDAEYTIVAKNISGEAKSSAQLLVEAKPQTPFTPISETLSLPPLSDKRADDLYPGTNELLKIAEEVHAKRRSVTGTAENMLQSADNKSAAEGVRKATSRALELLVDIEDSNKDPSPPPPPIRQETSPAKPPRGNAQKSVSKSPEMGQRSLPNDFSKERENRDKDSLEAKRKLVEMVVEETDFNATESDDVELNLTFQQYEKLYRLGAITREQIRKGRVPRNDLAKIQEALNQEEVISPEEIKNAPLEEVGLIDCGLKRIPSKRYKRDYIVNRSPKPQRRKWEVRPLSPVATAEVVKATPAGLKEQASLDDLEDEDLSRQDSVDDVFESSSEYFDLSKPAGEIIDSVEENIYMSSGKVYTLEERIKKLERSISSVGDNEAEEMERLEDEVAMVVAQTMQSEHKVQDIERTVAHLEERLQEPERDWHRRRTSQDDSLVRMSSFERDEMATEQTSQSPVLEGAEGPPVELRSVKNLRSLFAEDLPRNPDGSVKRIYSLTGRDIPKTVREKLRKQPSSVLPGSETEPDWQTSSRNEPKKRGALSSLFDDSELRVQPSADGPGKVSSPTPTTPASPSQISIEQVHESNKIAVSQNWVAEEEQQPSAGATGGASHRSPAVLARAAFWDKRITREQSEDSSVQEDFPEMPTIQRRLQRKAANYIQLQLKEFDHDEV